MVRFPEGAPTNSDKAPYPRRNRICGTERATYLYPLAALPDQTSHHQCGRNQFHALFGDLLGAVCRRHSRGEFSCCFWRVLAGALVLSNIRHTYAPLAQGRTAEDATLAAIGHKHGASAAQVAIA